MHNLISVIVPCYNAEVYLDRCVQSIVLQTYSKLEIILVDDGSTDNTYERCREWMHKDSRIHVIHKQNGGLSDARNVGLDNSHGEYIAFVDSDDYIHPTMFELLYNALIKNNADISVCGVYRTDGKDDVELPFGYKENISCLSSIQALKDILTNRCMIAAWNKLYRKSSIGNLRFIKGRYNEDFPFLYELYKKKLKVTYVTSPLYYYYINPNGITGKFSEKLLDGLKNAIEICNKENKETTGLENELKEYLDRNVIGAIRMLYLNHAVNMYPNQFTYCRKYAIKNSSRLLLSKKFTIKMKLWLLLAIFNF